jgi:PPM family protein phosphatase
LSSTIPKNVITRSLGPSPNVLVDIEGPFALKQGDRFLLCSDGLTGHVEDSEIGPLLAALPPDLATRILVDLANLRGGADNITVLVVDVLAGSTTQKESRLGKPVAQELPWPLLASVGICLFAAMLLGISGNIGPMVVALVLGTIAGGFAAAQYRRRLSGSARSVGPDGVEVRRSGPYRSYSAKPNAELLSRLDHVISALKTAAQERQWKIDWNEVDALIASDQQFRRERRFADAIRVQAQAIVATMKQLRNQQRGGGDQVAT